MSQIVLKACGRTETGSRASRRLRRNGRIPGVLYGRKGEAKSLEMDALEFMNSIKHISETTIVKVELDGETHDAFVKDMQRNIINGKVLHVDFYEVESGVILRAKVSIHIQGNPVGVREGGSLEVPMHDVEVECLPQDLPERIIVDVSGLGVNQSIHVRDLGLGSGVRTITGSDQVVAVVKFAKAEAPPPEEDAPPQAEAKS
ncbi:MAG: 50S ribosomal protein L25 [Spirochaetaceae bacterium]|nr:50S ribosomal protein L25 [Spirochaetaceae bacterium]